MSDPWTAIGAVIGGGGVLGLIAVVLVFVTKGAIEKSVSQAGSRELEKLRASLAEDLERLKTDLTFGAEVRRQAAIRKVDQIVKIAAATEAMMDAFENEKLGARDRNNAVETWWRLAREAYILLGDEAHANLSSFSSAIFDTNYDYRGIDMAPDHDVPAIRWHFSQALQPIRKRLPDSLRAELRGGMTEEVEKKS